MNDRLRKGKSRDARPRIPLAGYREYPVEEMRARLREFYADVGRRRSVRDFSDRPVPRDIPEETLREAPQIAMVSSFRKLTA